jgi:hypothetical protein
VFAGHQSMSAVAAQLSPFQLVVTLLVRSPFLRSNYFVLPFLSPASCAIGPSAVVRSLVGQSPVRYFWILRMSRSHAVAGLVLLRSCFLFPLPAISSIIRPSFRRPSLPVDQSSACPASQFGPYSYARVSSTLQYRHQCIVRIVHGH